MNNWDNEVVYSNENIIFKPENFTDLRYAVKEWIIDIEKALDNYGPIANWNTSLIIDMSYLFYFDEYDVHYFEQYEDNYHKLNEFNDDISNWDVSNVTDMSFMFKNCNSFNKSLYNWNVSNVINMEEMFYKAISFNQPLNLWNVSNVINMKNMFNSTIKFNQDINNWNIIKVCDYRYIFDYCPIKTINKPNFFHLNSSSSNDDISCIIMNSNDISSYCISDDEYIFEEEKMEISDEDQHEKSDDISNYSYFDDLEFSDDEDDFNLDL